MHQRRELNIKLEIALIRLAPLRLHQLQTCLRCHLGPSQFQEGLPILSAEADVEVPESEAASGVHPEVRLYRLLDKVSLVYAQSLIHI